MKRISKNRRNLRRSRRLRFETLNPRIVLASDWQSPENHLDTNADGFVSAIDALPLINELNGRGLLADTGRLPDRAEHPDAPFYDVDGDGWLAPKDVLRVFLVLNAGRSDEQAAPAPPTRARAVAKWDGGGDGRTWNDPLNWSHDRLPSQLTNVRIDADWPAIVIDAKATAARVASEAPLLIKDGELISSSIIAPSVNISTAGRILAHRGISPQVVVKSDVNLLSGSFQVSSPTTIQGELLAAPGSTIESQGRNSELNVLGATTIHGANLLADQGGRIHLPRALNYDSPTAGKGTIRAVGEGTMVVLPSLTSLSGLHIEAVASANIDLSNTVSVREVSLEMQNGGDILLPKLQTVVGSEIVANQVDAFGQLRQLKDATFEMRGYDQQLPELVSMLNSQLKVSHANLEAPNLTTIDGTRIQVGNESAVHFPSVTHLSGSNRWEINGEGSELDLSNLASVTAGDSCGRLDVRVFNRARLDLSGLHHVDLVEGNDRCGTVAMRSGRDSRIDLHVDFATQALDESPSRNPPPADPLVADAGWSPGSSRARGADLIVDESSAPSILQLESITGGTLRVRTDASFPNLVAANGTRIIVENANADFPVLRQIDNARLAIHGGTLALPSVEHFEYGGNNNLTKDRYGRWTVVGPDSRLELPNLRSIEINAAGPYPDGFWVTVEEGGYLDMHQVENLVVRQPLRQYSNNWSGIEVQGQNSTVDLSALGSLIGAGWDQVQLIVRDEARLLLPRLESLVSASLSTNGTSQLVAPAIRSMQTSQLRVADGSFHFDNLMSATNSSFDVSNATMVTPRLKNIDESEFHLLEGSVWDLDTVTSYRLGLDPLTDWKRDWRVEGKGTYLGLRHLEIFPGSPLFEVSARQGTIDLSGVTRIIDREKGGLNLRAADSGTIRLDQLTRFDDLTNTSSITTRSGGQIFAPLWNGSTFVTQDLQPDQPEEQEEATIPSWQQPDSEHPLPVVPRLPADETSSLASLISSIPATVTWIGSDGDWHNPANWSHGRVPGIRDRVIVDVSGQVPLTISSGAQAVHDLMIDGRLEIAAGSLSVSGSSSASAIRLAPTTALRVEGDQASFHVIDEAVLDGASIEARLGAHIELPARSYSHVVTEMGATAGIVAEGHGSVITFPVLTSIAGADRSQADLRIHALSGGRIQFPSLRDIGESESAFGERRTIDVTAAGLGSTIEMPVLEKALDHEVTQRDTFHPVLSQFRSAEGGRIHLPSLRHVRGFRLLADSTSEVQLTELETLVQSQVGLGSGADLASFSTLSVLDGTVVEAINSNFRAPQVASLDGASFIATGRSSIEIGGSGTFDTAPTVLAPRQSIRWAALGAQARVILSGLTRIVDDGGEERDLRVEAVGGGIVELPELESVNVANDIHLSSVGTDSRILVPALREITDTTNYASYVNEMSTIHVASSGSIEADALRSLTGVRLRLTKSDALETHQWQDFVAGEMFLTNGEASDFAALQRADRSRFDVAGSDVDFPRLTALDGASLIARAGAVVSLPAVTSYAHRVEEEYERGAWKAHGIGSQILMPNLETMTFGDRLGTELFVQAMDGGLVDLPSLQTVADVEAEGRHAVHLEAVGQGSHLQLPRLVSLTNRWGAPRLAGVPIDDFLNWRGLVSDGGLISARDGGAISAPRLESIHGFVVALNADGALMADELRRLTSGRLTFDAGAENTLGRLSDISGSTIVVKAGSPNLSQVESANGSGFDISHGGVLTLPGVTSYDFAGSGEGTWREWTTTGHGSRIEFPNLASITGGDYADSRLWMRALAGGQIYLPQLQTIRDSEEGDSRERSVALISEGKRSLIDLPKLEEFVDRDVTPSEPLGHGHEPLSNYSSIEASLEGRVSTPRLTHWDGISATLGNSSHVQTDQLQSITNSQLRIQPGAASADLEALQSALLSELRVEHAGISLPGLNQIDGTSLHVRHGQLALPSVTRFDAAPEAIRRDVSWEVHGATAVLDLRAIESIESDQGQTRWGITARERGRIDLSALTRIARVGGDQGNAGVSVRSEGEIVLGPGVTEVVGVEIDLEDQATLRGNLFLQGNSQLSGSGVIDGDIVNAGLIRPRQLLVTGNLQQEPTGELNVTDDAAGIQLDIARTLFADGILRLVPSGPLPTVRLQRPLQFGDQSGEFDLVDLNGNAGLGGSASWQSTGLTIDHGFDSGPRVLSATRESNSYYRRDESVEITFSEPLDSTTFVAPNVRLARPDGQLQSLAIEPLNQEGTRWQVSWPTLDLQEGVYELVIGTPIRDLSGQALNTNGNLTNGDETDAYRMTFETALPDLVPTSIHTSRSVVFHEHDLTVTWTVANQGAEIEDYHGGDRLYLSRDRVLDAADIPLDSYGRHERLENGDYVAEERIGGYEIFADGERPAGVYYVIAVVNDWCRIPESDATNNTIVSAPIEIEFIPNPIRITAISAPTSVEGDDELAIEWEVENTSKVSVGVSTGVAISADGRAQGSHGLGRVNETILPGERKKIQITVRASDIPFDGYIVASAGGWYYRPGHAARSEDRLTITAEGESAGGAEDLRPDLAWAVDDLFRTTAWLAD